jgi:hypothetical protein
MRRTSMPRSRGGHRTCYPVSAARPSLVIEQKPRCCWGFFRLTRRSSDPRLGVSRRHMVAVQLPGRHSAGNSQAYPHQSTKLGLWPKFAGGIVQRVRVRGGRRMSLWWLSFKGGATIIVRADTLVHARLLAAGDKAARAYLFDAGFRVDPEFEQIIPDNLIGRTLSRDEAADLQRWLRGDARYSRGR